MMEWYWVVMAFVLGLCIGSIATDLKNNFDERDKEIPWGF